MKRAPLCVLALLAGCSNAPLQSDWERAHLREAPEEETVPLPRYPRPADLVPFEVPGSAGFRYFVDGSTLSVGPDRAVRYVLVARSASGADNVSFEGLRCATHHYRIYAVGIGEGRWQRGTGSWQPLRDPSVAPARRVLERRRFCAADRIVRDADDALAALRSPMSSNTGD